MHSVKDSNMHLRLRKAGGARTLCVACGLCAAHCPVQCIRVDWKQGKQPGRLDPMDAPVTIHLGQPVLTVPRQDPPPAALFGPMPGNDPRQAMLHLGRPIPVSRNALATNRQRRQPRVFLVDHAKCIRCGLCVDICPVRALEFDQGPVGEDLLQDYHDRVFPETMEQNKGARP